MKAFYLISCVCFAMYVTIEANSGEVQTIVDKLKAEVDFDVCRNASGITLEFAEKLSALPNDADLPEMKEATHKIGCFLSCMLQQKGMMNGTVINTPQIVEFTKQLADSSEENNQGVMGMVVGLIEHCNRQTENMTDVCAIGWSFGNCVGSLLGV